MEFHKNINSLRALAVAVVVLFHFKVPGFSGGFVGVDVFFVISGFLMTGIIFNGLTSKKFSLLYFYASRARRIIPALAALCIILIVLGFFYLPASDYRELLRTAKESILFASNITFAKEGDYFDAPLQENWLLHTWSLSVEWQFYIIYPLILGALFKLTGSQKTKIALIFIGTASLIASIFISTSNPSAAFYLLPTRAWEMIAGGLVFLYPIKSSLKTKKTLEYIGLTLIILSIAFLSEKSVWPGYLALFPVIGAMLVVHTNTNSLFSTFPPFQHLGNISYSVYLWHWPIVVFLYTCGLLNETSSVFIGITLSILLGYLSYKLIEIRVPRVTAAKLSILKFGGLVVCIAVVSAILVSAVKKHPEIRFTFKEDNPPEYSSQLFTKECTKNSYKAAECKLGSGTLNVILLGDSHAEATAAAIQLKNNGSSLSWARGGCPSLSEFNIKDKESEADCKAFNNDKLEKLKTIYPGTPVVLFSKMGAYSDLRYNQKLQVSFDGINEKNQQEFNQEYIKQYKNFVCRITSQNPTFIVRPIPEMPFSIYKGLNLQRRILGTNSDITLPIKSYMERNILSNLAIDEAAKSCGAKVLDPTPYLCPDGQCMGSKDGVPLYYDDNHLVDAGNLILQEMFSSFFQENPPL